MDKPIVVEAGFGQRKRGWLNPRNVIIALVLLVALIGGGLAVWHWHTNRDQQAGKVDAALAQSQAAYNGGDYTNALNLLTNVAAKATSNSQKAKVYQLEAQAAAGATKFADAAHFYELKHQVDPGSAGADAFAVGSIYQQLGQKDKALAQYKIALTYANAHHSQYNSDAPAIQAAISALENQQ